MEKLLKFLIANIVRHPEDVKISKDSAESGITTYTISVHPEDLGQVIGRQGKIIQALRRLSAILAIKKGARINLQLLETQKT